MNDEVTALAYELWVMSQGNKPLDERVAPMITALMEFAESVRATERELCAQYLRDAAVRIAPEQKQTNQVDRHTAHVLATKGDELAHGCHLRA